jgi:hypothetical protein
MAGQLNYPNSIAVDYSGNLFIGEYGRVRKVTPDGIITTVAGGGTNNPGDGGPATSAQISTAVSVAVDGAGDLFIVDLNYDSDSDNSTYRFHKVTPDGIINSLPAVPNCCYGQIAADGAGNLIVPAGGTIWKSSPSGNQTVVPGNGSYGPPSGDGGPATLAQLNGPTAVALGPAGDLFIADNTGRSISRVTSDGIIRTIASIASSAPSSGDGGPATSAQLQLAVQGLSAQSGWRWIPRATCTSRKPEPIEFAKFPRTELSPRLPVSAARAVPARPPVFLWAIMGQRSRRHFRIRQA